MEIAVEFVMYPYETTLVKVVPDRLQDRSVPYVAEVILYYKFQVLVDAENSHHVERWLHTMENGITLMPDESMMIDSLKVFLMELLDRYSQDRRVDEYPHFLVAFFQQFVFPESQTEVGSHGNTTLDGIRFIYKLMLGFTVDDRETECIVAYSDSEPCL